MSYIQELKEDVKEIYESRNILKSLIVKNLIGHYKNSIMGFMWHFITPIIMMIIYYIVFTQIRVNTIPNFWVFIASALFPFTFMVSNLSGGAGCIVSNAPMVKKMYFPREIIVYSQIISSFIVMLLGYIIVLIASALFGTGISINWLILPLILVIMGVFVTGYVLIFSALTVYVRDVQYFLSSTSIVFFFLTPMYFTLDSITGFFRLIVDFNPFTYFVECYHQIIYYNQLPDAFYIFVCVTISLISIGLGIAIFHKLRRGFVERL